MAKNIYENKYSLQNLFNFCYDESGRYISTSLDTGLHKSIDSVTASPEETSYVNLTASGVVCGATCKLIGMYVNSTSAGTVKFWDNASAGSGTVINNTITPAVGYHPLGRARAGNGVYATIGGTIDVTFYYIAL